VQARGVTIRALAWLAFAGLAFGYVLLGNHYGTQWLVAPWDKAVHFALYAASAALLWLGCGGQRPRLILLALSVLGALDELMQTSVPGRSGDFANWAIDTLSAVITIALIPRVQPGLGAALLQNRQTATRVCPALRRRQSDNTTQGNKPERNDSRRRQGHTPATTDLRHARIDDSGVGQPLIRVHRQPSSIARHHEDHGQ
jgi:hypothetical protein